jgi:sugar transferase (PEP-CTERM system associated)
MQAILGGMTWRRSSLVVMDHALIVSAVLLAVILRAGPSHRLVGWDLLWRASIIGVVLQLCLHYVDLYDVRTLRHRPDLIVGLLQGLGAGSLILVVLYYWVPQLILGRGIFLIGAILIAVLISAWRIAFEWLSSRVGPRERLLIVGTSGAALELARELEDRRSELGVELSGFISAGESRDVSPELRLATVGTIQDIPRIVRERRVDRVVVSLADARGKLSMEHLLEMKLNDGVRFDHLASVYEEYTGKIAVENLRPSYLIFSEGFRKTRVLSAAKRALDLIVASVGLVLTGPIMLLVAIAVRLSSRGPAFYHQLRTGQNGKTFMVHKFRSMRTDAEAKTGAVWSVKNDPRVTPVGRFLRRTRLDELPQFWNVIRGDMSIVGPRPERPEFVAELTKQIPFYGQRHAVRPGLTGWAQVRHSYGSTVEDALQKLQFDLFYIKHLSVAFDLFVILETIKTVLVRRGS